MEKKKKIILYLQKMDKKWSVLYEDEMDLFKLDKPPEEIYKNKTVTQLTDPEIVELWQAQKVLKSKNKLTIEFKLLLRKTT